MEIISKTKAKEVEFGRLKEGDVFTCFINKQVYVCLKIKPIYDDYGIIIYNVVDLIANDADYFSDFDLVTVI